MATTSSPRESDARSAQGVSIVRLIVAGAATAAAVFVLCWVGTLVPFGSPTHAYISLFTTAELSSTQALAEGTVWSLLFGALVGAVFALVYNATAAFGRMNDAAIRPGVNTIIRKKFSPPPPTMLRSSDRPAPGKDDAHNVASIEEFDRERMGVAAKE